MPICIDHEMTSNLSDYLVNEFDVCISVCKNRYM